MHSKFSYSCRVCTQHFILISLKSFIVMKQVERCIPNWSRHTSWKYSLQFYKPQCPWHSVIANTNLFLHTWICFTNKIRIAWYSAMFTYCQHKCTFPHRKQLFLYYCWNVSQVNKLATKIVMEIDSGFCIPIHT
jgi:hypothetical protein